LLEQYESYGTFFYHLRTDKEVQQSNRRKDINNRNSEMYLRRFLGEKNNK